jgi:hypothetical protein
MQRSSCPLLISFLTGMDLLGSKTKMALSMTVRFSGGKNRLVVNLHATLCFAPVACSTVLTNIARPLYSKEDFGLELDQTVYALDSSTIDLCLSLFPWARFRKRKSAIKLYTLLDLQGSIPSFISITDGKVHDVNVLDELIPEPGSIYVMDRAYLDFKRLYILNQCMAFFIIRSKTNTKFRRLYSHKIGQDDRTTMRSIDRPYGYKNEKAIP